MIDDAAGTFRFVPIDLLHWQESHEPVEEYMKIIMEHMDSNGTPTRGSYSFGADRIQVLHHEHNPNIKNVLAAWYSAIKVALTNPQAVVEAFAAIPATREKANFALIGYLQHRALLPQT